MIRKIGHRFSDKIMLKSKSWRSVAQLGARHQNIAGELAGARGDFVALLTEKIEEARKK